MTPSKLKQNYQKAALGPAHFFDRETMKFFGDTMGNFGVRAGPCDMWELYRKNPVRYGLRSVYRFDKKTFAVVRVIDGSLVEVSYP